MRLWMTTGSMRGSRMGKSRVTPGVKLLATTGGSRGEPSDRHDPRSDPPGGETSLPRGAGAQSELSLRTMGKAYNDEMQQVPATVRWAADQPVEQLHRAVHLYRDRGLLAIGSGGSFTAAALAADLHLRTFGRP
jgi:hypothetical protein